jgi:hypothetical protein
MAADVTVSIPGTIGMFEAKAAQLAAAVEWHFNMATLPTAQPTPRRPATGDLARPLQTARLA